MSVEEARLELAMIERRMDDFKAKLESGTTQASTLEELKLQYAKDIVRYQRLMAERETMERDRQLSLALSQQTLKSIQTEMQLVKQQIETMQKRVETGLMSPADPAMLQLQRDLLALQRKADEVSATIRKFRNFHPALAGVISSTTPVPRAGTQELAGALGIPLSEFKFFESKDRIMEPTDTARDGIFLAGYCGGPVDIPESVAQGSAAAARAMDIMTRKHKEAKA
jgi:hypothetical protein